MKLTVEISNERFVSLTLKFSPSDIDDFVAVLAALKLQHEHSFHLNGAGNKPPYIDIEISVDPSILPSDWTNPLVSIRERDADLRP